MSRFPIFHVNLKNFSTIFFFWNFEKSYEKKIASFFWSYVVLELARFARGRIQDSSFNRFALNGIPELPATLFFGMTRKIKIGNLVFLSIQPIPDLSCKFDHFWKNKLDFDLHGHHGFSSKSKNFIFYFWNFWNLDERSAIGWIESRTKFQNSPIFIFWVMVILVSFLWKNHPNFRWLLEK